MQGVCFEADSLAQADCVAVHKLLKDRLGAEEAANEWYKRCQQLYQQSTYFEGCVSAPCPRAALPLQQTGSLKERNRRSSRVDPNDVRILGVW